MDLCDTLNDLFFDFDVSFGIYTSIVFLLYIIINISVFNNVDHNSNNVNILNYLKLMKKIIKYFINVLSLYMFMLFLGFLRVYKTKTTNCYEKYLYPIIINIITILGLYFTLYVIKNVKKMINKD